MNVMEQVHRISQKIVRGMEHPSYEEWLRTFGLFSLEKRGLWGDLIVTFQCYKVEV